MLKQSPSQIYKSENRGKIINEKYNCFSVFNYLPFQEKSRAGFHGLKVVNDETLASSETINYSSEQDEIIVLLPLVGAIEINSDKLSEIINVNELYFFESKKGDTFSVSNSYNDELVNYLQIRFSSDASENHKIYFDLETTNEIISLHQNDDFAISIGVFDARNEGIHKLKNPKKGLFTYVLGGAFEFQNRLLETRDALKIWQIAEVEFEALSPMAMLLIIDVLK